MFDITEIIQTFQSEVSLHNHFFIQPTFIADIMSDITKTTQTSQSNVQSNHASKKLPTSSCKWENKVRQNKNQSYAHMTIQNNHDKIQDVGDLHSEEKEKLKGLLGTLEKPSSTRA